MELVGSAEELIRNAVLFDNYSRSSINADREFYVSRLRLGKTFLHLNVDGHHVFCPSRFVGYRNNSRQRHEAFEGKHGGLTNVRIKSIIGPYAHSAQIEAVFQQVCQRVGVTAAHKVRDYWSLKRSKNDVPEVILVELGDYPDEISTSRTYIEGTIRRVTVNGYERDPQARQQCIESYGCQCCVCGLSFEKKYGRIGAGFIHVHHLVPLSALKQEYEIDPIKDLRPVCPNCHAMLHKSDPPFSIEELRELIDGNRNLTGRSKPTPKKRVPPELRR